MFSSNSLAEYHYLLSGINAQKVEQKDLLRAEQVGKLQAERFTEERIKSNHTGFYKTIKKNKLKTFTRILAKENVSVKDRCCGTG